MVKLSELAVNVADASEGRWFTYRDDFEVCIRYASGVKYDQARQRLVKTSKLQKAGRIKDGAKMTRAIRRELIPVFAQWVVVDWRGIEDEQDQPIAYDPKMMADLLAKPEWEAFYQWLYLTAFEPANFGEEPDDEDDLDDDEETEETIAGN